MKRILSLSSILVMTLVAHQAHADTAGLAAARVGVMSSSAPLGATFITSLGSTEASSSSSRMKLAAREDAALYVASNGEEERPALEQAYQTFLSETVRQETDKMSFAVELLAYQ